MNGIVTFRSAEHSFVSNIITIRSIHDMQPPSNSTALTHEKLFMRVINYLLFARTVSYSSNGSPINGSYIF